MLPSLQWQILKRISFSGVDQSTGYQQVDNHQTIYPLIFSPPNFLRAISPFPQKLDMIYLYCKGMKTMNCSDDWLKQNGYVIKIFPRLNKFQKSRNIPFLPLHTNLIMQVIPDNVTGYISVQQEMVSTLYNMKVSNISTLRLQKIYRL